LRGNLKKISQNSIENFHRREVKAIIADAVTGVLVPGNTGWGKRLDTKTYQSL
jgi:hypothetical protein